MSEDSEYHRALKKLKPLIKNGSENADLFYDACKECNAISTKSGGKSESVQRNYHAYIADAIDIMERRKDGYADKSFLLFNEKAEHIKELRRSVHRVMHVFAQGTKENKLATSIGNALDAVIAAAKPFQNMPKIEGESGFQVIGYGCGMIAHEYGKWGARNIKEESRFFTGNAIIEIKIEDLWNVKAKNGFFRHSGVFNEAPNGQDLRIIFKDGSTHSFNWKEPGSQYFDKSVTKRLEHAARDVYSSRIKETPEDWLNTEKRLTSLVLKLEKEYPARINTSLGFKNYPNL